MIQFDEALGIVLGTGVIAGVERTGINEALNRVLAEDARSDIQMPPFNKSAVDGYACRTADIASQLKVIEVVPAGKMPQRAIGKNQCSKVMTGAPVPVGADAVIMVEDVEDAGDGFIRYKKDSVRSNICYTGEDMKAGQVVVKEGTLIQPQHIAIMATAGCVDPQVYRQVRVGVISTGDELVEPDEKPGLSQIRNSNAFQLAAQVRKMGAIPEYLGIASDNIESTREKIMQAFAGNDVVLLTGGVSAGDFDYVPGILIELGVQLKFDSIAVQPGRPTVFGTLNDKCVFGLPGNPVSSFVLFELLVKPLVYKMTGHDYSPLALRLVMAEEYRRKRSGRLSWLPVKINERGEVVPLEYHGSAHINALTLADGLISIPIGKTLLEKGELVDVRQI